MEAKVIGEVKPQEWSVPNLPHKSQPVEQSRLTHRRQPFSPVRVPPARPVRARAQSLERLRLKLRPMSEAEAVSELQADSQPVVVYLDENSGEIQIMVRRADGSLAVIEPVVP